MSRRKIRPEIVQVDWKAVGSRIRELRGFDLTQADVAARIGICQGYLSAIERGKAEIGAAVLLSIAREFDTSLEWLLTGDQKDF